MYTPRPTMKNTLPHEGFFFLKEPVRCSDGVFEAGSIVRISAFCFNEADHTAEYKIYSLNESEVISDKYYFHENDKWSEIWNEKFASLNGTSIASGYYDKITELNKEDANINRKSEILDIVETIIIPIAGLSLIMLITIYLVLFDKSLPLARTFIIAIASIGIIAALVALEKHFGYRRKNIAESIKQCELNAFFALEKVSKEAKKNDYLAFEDEEKGE